MLIIDIEFLIIRVCFWRLFRFNIFLRSQLFGELSFRAWGYNIIQKYFGTAAGHFNYWEVIYMIFGLSHIAFGVSKSLLGSKEKNKNITPHVETNLENFNHTSFKNTSNQYQNGSSCMRIVNQYRLIPNLIVLFWHAASIQLIGLNLLLGGQQNPITLPFVSRLRDKLVVVSYCLHVYWLECKPWFVLCRSPSLFFEGLPGLFPAHAGLLPSYALTFWGGGRASPPSPAWSLPSFPGSLLASTNNEDHVYPQT